jgi:hypothetical protein
VDCRNCENWSEAYGCTLHGECTPSPIEDSPSVEDKYGRRKGDY